MRTYPNLERISTSQASTLKITLLANTYTLQTTEENMELVQLSAKYDNHAKTCFKEDILVEICFSCYFDKTS